MGHTVRKPQTATGLRVVLEGGSSPGQVGADVCAIEEQAQRLLLEQLRLMAYIDPATGAYCVSPAQLGGDPGPRPDGE
jgi:hypothetical protein